MLRWRGWFVWRQNNVPVPGRSAIMPGLSDIIGLRRGRFLAVECKVPGAGPSEAQAAFLDAVRRHGGLGIVAHSGAELEAELLRDREQQEQERQQQAGSGTGQDDEQGTQEPGRAPLSGAGHDGDQLPPAAPKRAP